MIRMSLGILLSFFSYSYLFFNELYWYILILHAIPIFIFFICGFIYKEHKDMFSFLSFLSSPLLFLNWGMLLDFFFLKQKKSVLLESDYVLDILNSYEGNLVQKLTPRDLRKKYRIKRRHFDD